MSGLASAVVGSAAIGAIASNSASKRAAGAQRGASDAARLQAEIAREQYGDWKEIYRPREQEHLAQAFAFDTPERRAQAMRQAGDSAAATVAQQYGLLPGIMQRAMMRSGGASGLSEQAGLQLALRAAADRAGAINTARTAAEQRIEDQGWARQQDALSLGKGLASNASSGLASAGQTQAALANAQFNRAGQIGSSIGQAGFQLANHFFGQPSAAAPAAPAGGSWLSSPYAAIGGGG